MTSRYYYIACNPYEGCGHKHRKARSAARCLPRIEPGRGRVRVARIVRETGREG